MAITLTYSTTTITLPSDLQWSDELEWAPVEQTVTRSISGAVIVSAAQRIAGRPITLTPPNETPQWVLRNDLDTLRTWAAVPERQMTLSINGTSHTVIFRHQDGPIVATPVIPYQDVQPTDFYTVELRLMEV